MEVPVPQCQSDDEGCCSEQEEEPTGTPGETVVEKCEATLGSLSAGATEHVALPSPSKRPRIAWPELLNLAEELDRAAEAMDVDLQCAEHADEKAIEELKAAEEAWKLAEARRSTAQNDFLAAKTRLCQLEMLLDAALKAEAAAAPALEVFDRVAAKVSAACTALKHSVSAAEENLESLPPSLSELGHRLAAARSAAETSAAALALAEAAAADAEQQATLAEVAGDEEETRCRTEAAALQAMILADSQAQTKAAERRSADERLTAEAEAAASRAQAETSALLETCKSLEQEIKSLEAKHVAAAQAASCNADDGEAVAALKQKISELERLCEAKQAEQNTAENSAPGAEIAEAREQSRSCPEELLKKSDPSHFLMARSAKRLYVSTEDIPEVAGEYRILEDATTKLPTYKSTGPRSCFLFWTPKQGGRWSFGPDLAEAEPLLAHSLQLSWTALPDELMSDSWSKGASSMKGKRARVVVLRG